MFFNSGVDPTAVGLQASSEVRPKILDALVSNIVLDCLQATDLF